MEITRIMSNTITIRWAIILITTIIGLLALVNAKTGPTHDKVVVCYIATWAVYRPGKGSYAIENFDPNLCTHVVYAFAGLDITKDAIKSLDPWQDLKDNYGKGGFERINKLKKIHPHLKVTLAIGGWNEGSKNYSMLASDPARRQRFVKQVSEYIRQYNFDGLDLDWEYPTQRQGEPEDRENFVALVKELRSEFNKHNLILTSAIGASKTVIDQAYDVRTLSKLLDFMHIMCYDYGGSWDRKVGANAPLAGDGPLNVMFTIEYLIKLGASPSKIVMGLPFYGRTFKTQFDGYYGDAADDVGFQGPYTKENGFLGYNEICSMLSNKTSGWKREWDAPTAQSIARFKDEEMDNTLVVTYDSTRSIANKMKFAMKKELAGAMIWSIDTDDFLGECDIEDDTYSDYGDMPGVKLNYPKRINTNYPLLRTVNEGIVLALDEIEQENEIRNREKENEIPHGENTQDSEQNNGIKSFNSFKVYLIGISLSFFVTFYLRAS
ncbi:probable chitinase 2 [Condylostylus longicornis]|uniref:probable chitinase 2 n=1 Tax=Condylostylus longicornis TaxID=2530218 RepID=UPI00244E3A28|nr:probable chitinase 2 [Condylostylus longicornis]XP_055378606.1 probable chitinase 2 [Condylostylus longicornis]XP_055378607.1 probable chitinase 2 [Condylostylus longicornis]XP_055378608.1 probable chitinase 2 [Condylostylus longicornis]